uniref:ER membrane protein complex subunit 4 n=1 Tax=Angiostrongylus cantonensis TaxID=6313 RepID=A0A158P7P5_ANGCA
MDPEASYGDESLTASVSLRRRSHSFSDDYSIQRTNDDATQCKLAAVQLGYWKDEFLSRFIQRCPTNSFRRDPEISIGYWARVSVINQLVERFVEKTAGRCQIINIANHLSLPMRNISAKEIQHSDLHCGDYSLVGADLRQWNEFRSKLDSVTIDTTLPTLFVAECVLVYMSVDQSAQLLKHISSCFDTVVFINYEQVHTKDTFGNIMEKNLEQRGIQLPGIAACSDIETQKKRIEKIEHLDEMELLRQLLDHYCICYAVTDRTEKYHMSLAQWKLDYTVSSRNCRTSDSAFNPPGFHPGVTSAQHHVDIMLLTVPFLKVDSEHASEQQEHLAKKRAWDVAMAPAKSLPMNMFMMYMAGRSVSIFPIMMVGMMLWRPAKALFSVNATFKPLEDQNAGNLIIHKIIFILGNMGAIALAIYKVHTMGLLPNTPSDWLEFIPQPQRVQYSIVSNTYV